MFYGGIAARRGDHREVAEPARPANLKAYLFGAITTATSATSWCSPCWPLVVLAVTWLLRPWLFAVANDEEYARASGLPGHSASTSRWRC